MTASRVKLTTADRVSALSPSTSCRISTGLAQNFLPAPGRRRRRDASRSALRAGPGDGFPPPERPAGVDRGARHRPGRPRRPHGLRLRSRRSRRSTAELPATSPRIDAVDLRRVASTSLSLNRAKTSSTGVIFTASRHVLEPVREPRVPCRESFRPRAAAGRRRSRPPTRFWGEDPPAHDGHQGRRANAATSRDTATRIASGRPKAPSLPGR